MMQAWIISNQDKQVHIGAKDSPQLLSLTFPPPKTLFLDPRKRLYEIFIYLTDIINYIVIDSPSVFRTDPNLDKAIKNPKCLPAAIGAVLYLHAFLAVK